MKLADGSDLIDKGVDVGKAFTGSAPDIGPFEKNQIIKKKMLHIVASFLFDTL